MFSGTPRHPIESSSVAQRKTWRAGTLTYTTAGLLLLFFWLLWGDFAWSMKDRGVPGVAQLLLKKFHASDTLTSLLIGSLPAALTMVLMPIIGYKSDRHRGRWGRRIPFLLIPTPLAVIGMVSLAFSPQIGAAVHQALGPHSPGINNCILLFFGASWTLFEFAAIMVNSIFNALINDVVPQEVLGRFYGAFRALSLIAGMIFYFWLFGTAETYYFWIFIGMAALYGGAFTMMCLKVREGAYPPSVPMDAGRETKGFLHAAKTYCQECFGHSYYRWYFVAIGLSWQAFIPANLFNIYYAKTLHMDNNVFGECIAITYIISLALAYPLGALVDRFHPLRVSIFALMLYALVSLWGALFIHDSFTFGVALVAHGVISGSWFTAIASIGQRLLPKAEFAQFASAAGIIQALATILVGPAVGLFLDHVVHHMYRYTFYIGFGISVAALLCNLVLHRKFVALGGPKNYVAPEFVRQSS